jgi:pimeloyl-ACP methyl ester carboxylesterase
MAVGLKDVQMVSWVDGYWLSDDGLRLHYRDYPGPEGKADGPPILCIPGLTRNARDFEAVAERLSSRRRLICVELRGRGESAYARNAMNYAPPVYLGDLELLLEELTLDRFVLFGTSLGGLMAMLLALRDSRRFAGALLNDIGPELDPRGLERIRGYVGRSQSWPTWLHAARYYAAAQGEIYPAWKLKQWLVQAKRLCRLNANGRIVIDYDIRIAEPMKSPPAEGSANIDLWEAFAALREVPTLVVRGARSDILAPATLDRMKAEHPLLDVVTVPRVGHAPTLEEPAVSEAIDRLLERST